MCVPYNELLQHMEMDVSLSASIDSSPSPRPKTNPSADHFQFSCTLYILEALVDEANIDSCCDSASCTILVCV